MVCLGFAWAPAAAAPTPAPVPTEWFDPLPGYDPNLPLPEGPLEAFTYEASPHLLAFVHEDPPDPDELSLLGPRDAYPYGTMNNMLADWRDKRRPKLPQNMSAADLKKAWKRFVEGYVRGVDSNKKGPAYEQFLNRKDGIAGSKDYTFGAKVPYAAEVEPDVFPLRPHLKKIKEQKHTRTLTDRAQKQLGEYVKLADATGDKQVVYEFGVVPTKGTLKRIADANRETAVNRARIAAQMEVVPAIVPILRLAVPQPVPMKDPDFAAWQAKQRAGRTANAPAGTGGGGVMVAPGAPQLPVGGALDDAVSASPDSPEEAAAENQLLDEMGVESGNEDVGAPDNLGGVDFSTLELRYVSDHYQGGSGLQYAFRADAASDDTPSYGGRRAARLASDAFFVWLALPPSLFTVNLNPDEPDRILDDRLAQTDAGRVLLEADLEMKKLAARLTHPDTPLGQKFWNELDSRGGASCVSARVWIVPEPATVREDRGQLYILETPLTVKMETEYFKARGAVDEGSACRDQSPSVAQHNEAVYRTTVLPEVAKAVNRAPEFADLRRVYVSRVAAQWYRERSAGKPTAYSTLIDSGDVSRWPSREPWRPQDIYQRMMESFTKGEYNVTRTTERFGRLETRVYINGGVDFTNILRSALSQLVFRNRWPALPVTVGRARDVASYEQDGRAVWLGSQTTAVPLTELVTTPATASPLFYAVIGSPVVIWLAVGVLLLSRRWRRRRGIAPPTATPAAP